MQQAQGVERMAACRPRPNILLISSILMIRNFLLLNSITHLRACGTVDMNAGVRNLTQ